MRSLASDDAVVVVVDESEEQWWSAFPGLAELSAILGPRYRKVLVVSGDFWEKAIDNPELYIYRLGLPMPKGGYTNARA